VIDGVVGAPHENNEAAITVSRRRRTAWSGDAPERLPYRLFTVTNTLPAMPNLIIGAAHEDDHTLAKTEGVGRIAVGGASGALPGVQSV
jgi:hypothetical protein